MTREEKEQKVIRIISEGGYQTIAQFVGDVDDETLNYWANPDEEEDDDE